MPSSRLKRFSNCPSPAASGASCWLQQIRAAWAGGPTPGHVPVGCRVGGFRRGEPHAVRALYREYGRLVYAVALRALGRADLAEDATQQTFVRVRGRRPIASTSSVTRHHGSRRSRSASPSTSTATRPAGPAGSIDDAAPDDTALVTLPPELDTLDAVWHVRRAIDTLPSEESAIVRMQHLEGMTHTEISEKLAIPVGTVKSRSHRAHEKLAALLGHLRDPVYE